jgi:hypothetical protein
MWLQVKLGLYTLLHEQNGGLTAAEISQRLQLNTQTGFRGVRDWLDVLVTLDTLQRAGKCSKLLAVLNMTPLASSFACTSPA